MTKIRAGEGFRCAREEKEVTMNLNLTGRQFDITPSIREYVEARIASITEDKSLKISSVNVVMEREKERYETNIVLNCKDLLSISKIAKDYGKSAIWLNDKLAELKVQYKQGGVWLLYQRYAEKGYTSTKTHTYPANDGEIHSKILTMWTQKGRLFIYELLKARGILPLIERG